MDPITLTLLILCLVLMAAELVLPGGVSFALGLSAGIVAALRFTGVIEDTLTTFTSLPIFAIFFTAIVYKFLSRYFSGTATYDVVSDEMDINDDVVDVLVDVSASHENGRVSFRGTSWKAVSRGEPIQKGGKAKVVSHDGIILIVEPGDQ